MQEEQRRRDQLDFDQAQAEEEQRRIEEEAEGLLSDGYHAGCDSSQEAKLYNQCQVDQQARAAAQFEDEQRNINEEAAAKME
eukprot:8333076-Pyramimonas_sp.AAC.1